MAALRRIALMLTVVLTVFTGLSAAGPGSVRAAGFVYRLVHESLSSDGWALHRTIEIVDPVFDRRSYSGYQIPLPRAFSSAVEAKRHLITTGRGEELRLPRYVNEVAPSVLDQWRAEGYEPVWEYAPRPPAVCPAPASGSGMPAQVRVEINGRPVDGSVAAYLETGHALLSARSVLRQVGAEVLWLGDGTLTVRRGDTAVHLRVGNREAHTPGGTVSLPVPVALRDGTTFVPAAVVRLLGDTVTWDAAQRRVLITSDHAVAGSETARDQDLPQAVRWPPRQPQRVVRVDLDKVATHVVDGKILLEERGTQRTVTVHDLAGGQVLHRFRLPENTRIVRIFGDEIIGDPDVRLVSLDARTGDLRWCRPIKLQSAYDDPVAADGTRLYVVDEDMTLHALDRATGATLWTFERADVGFIFPVGAGDLVLARGVHAQGIDVYALDARDGTVRWIYPAVRDPGALGRLGRDNRPVVHGDMILFADEGVLHALDRNGTPVWTYNLTGSINDLAVADGTVYLTQHLWVRRTNDSCPALTAIDVRTGAERWVHRAAGCGRAIVLTGDRAYVSVDDGGIAVVDRATGRAVGAWTVEQAAGWFYDYSFELVEHQGVLYLNGHDVKIDPRFPKPVVDFDSWAVYRLE